MSKLKDLVYGISEFGVNSNIASTNKTGDIQKLLVGLYYEYLNLKMDFDSCDFDEAPEFDYVQIRKNVESNFPELGWYYSVWESHEIIKIADVTTRDAIDDLSDIVKDMLEIKWQFENTSRQYAEWSFKDLMKIHSEQHILNFLKYLKDKNG